MPGTRWKVTLRGMLGTLHRELRITLTPRVEPEKWLFIVGCYNSGTTLLTRLLETVSGLSVLPEEGQFLTDQLSADYELGLPRMWALREDLFRLAEGDDGPDPDRLEREWLMRLDRRQPVFVEKSPPNTARTRWLQQHFPNANFLAILRDPYAVSEGIRRKAEPSHLAAGWPIELCARQWRRSYELLEEDAPFLDRLLWLRYEDLAEDPEKELGRVLEFLSLPLDSAMPRIDGTWDVHERTEPIRNMNRESIDRLSPDEVRAITAEIGTARERFGYAVPDVGAPQRANPF